MEDLEETRDELDQVRKTLARSEEDRDIWRRLFENCNKNQGEEIDRLRKERIAKTEQPLTKGSIPREQSPIELLTPRQLNQRTEVQVPTGTLKMTTPDPSDVLGNSVVEKTMRQLVEAAGRLVANKSMPGFLE